MINENKIIRKGISTLLILALTLTGLFSFPYTVYAEKTILSEEIYYHLDMGIQVAYQGTEWEGRGFVYGDTELITSTVSFPDDVEVLDAYPLNSSKGSSFDFNGDTSSTNIPRALINESGSESYAYTQFYSLYISTSMREYGTAYSDGSEVTFSYSVGLKTIEPLEAVEKGRYGQDNDIWKLFGGKNNVQNADVKAAIENALIQGFNETAGGNKLYLVFCPTVIEYRKYVIIGDLDARLALPSSAKQEESFTISDASLVDESLTLDYATVEWIQDDGSRELIARWEGRGEPGKNSGGSITQVIDEPGSYPCILTAVTTNGQVDTDRKTIKITDNRKITIVADLVLPEFTYEGHTEIAADESTFSVDGINYSTERAYAENIASNNFQCSSPFVLISRLNSTKANVLFYKAGIYNVNLHVQTITGATGSDTESIEVRKTPYIIDNLSGFQKQNRKQVLDITVATYPGKPLTKFTIDLKDKVTGELIRLTQDDPQKNNATIKTRAVNMTQDIENGFAYITVEFLTKTPSFASTGINPQDFYYQIKVEDSKGDTDIASNTFSVQPDLPPNPAISIDTAFLRDEGTNVASIKAEDVTVATDGDEVERRWHFGHGLNPATFTDVSLMDGYQKLSFGTDKIVGFDKTGVGKFTVKLDVNEVWTEPTLEEYVTDADRLTGSTLSRSDILNVAPIVSLKLLKATEQEILLLANNDTEYQTLTNKKTELKQALLADKIDGRIIVKKLMGSTPSNVTGVQQQRSLTYPYPTRALPNGLATELNEGRVLAVDSEKTYFLQYTWINGDPTVPKTIRAIDTYKGEVWSYTTSRNEEFTFGHDDIGKYLYLIYTGSNQTVLLDKRTGAVAGTVNMALSEKMWISDDLMFMAEGTNLYAVNTNTLTKTLVAENASAVSRVNGKLQFITKEDGTLIRGAIDMKTMSIEKSVLIETTSKNDYTPLCIDSTGKAVFWKHTGNGADKFRGIRVYGSDNKFIKEIAVTANYTDPSDQIRYSLDESGRCNHVLYWVRRTKSSPDENSFNAINLNTGNVTIFNNRTDAYQNIWSSYAGAFESNGTSYFMFNGWYMHPGGIYYYGNNYTFTFTGTSISSGVSGPSTIGSLDENIKVSDRTVVALHGDNKPGTGYFLLKILAYPQSLAQETAEIVSRFTDKLTFIGNVGTTSEQIKAAAKAPKPTMKITAANGGYLTQNNVTFLPGKKYYYEYEIKPLTEGTESKLTGISAITGTETSGQSFLSNTLYVEKSYEEDFNDGSINPYFIVENPGLFLDGGYGIRTGTNNNDDTQAKLTFNVPAGKQAIMMFDYDMRYKPYYANDGIYIDGERVNDHLPTPDDYGNGSLSDFCIFRRVLYAGIHTIEFSGSSYSPYQIIIDNIKIDILSTKPKASGTSLNVCQGTSEDWLSVDGTFDVPSKVVSYGAQASTTYYGGMPSEIIGYDSDGNANNFNYYHTIPAGYLQKGRVHYYVNYIRSYAEFNIPGVGSRLRPDAYTNGWWHLGAPKVAGTYTYNVKYGSRHKNNSAGLDILDVVQYPYNAVTATGNIAFDNTFTKYYFPKESSTGKTNMSIYLPKGEYLIKNLKLYYIEDGQRVYLQNKDLDCITQLAPWTLSAGLSASIATVQDEEPDDEYIKIYKKGEKVLYNIFYEDYEDDPSKIGCWVYQHINWPPDGVHPDVGKVINEPIDRFYLSGKYTVTHWQKDNTQRLGTVGDAAPYNLDSQPVDLTFYVDGGGKAPWITYIKTNPATVKENNNYSISVGVDDSEKDILTLETEVYNRGKCIKTDFKTGITADVNGEYPEQIISGLPKAQVGIYQVICTVSDHSGVGIKSYKFTVVSEGRITGDVYHTEQWEINRKKYNLKRFSEEVNQPWQFSDYLGMSIPRKRGTNVFWSGEKFMLQAETEGEPVEVTVEINSFDSQGNLRGTGYSAELRKTGKKTASGGELWGGSIWENSMINKWGRKSPESLYFDFTAYYSGGLTREHTVSVIVDSDRDYWQLHRLW